MITIKPTYENNSINGAWLINDKATIYVPFSLCIVIADCITFYDNDIIGSQAWAGYIEIYFDYDGSILLSDGDETVIIMKNEIKDVSKQLWDMI